MKMLLCLMFVMVCSSLAMAETINLKDGKVIVGKILQKDDQAVKIEVSGIAVTYYLDEIKDIDGVAVVKEMNKPVMPVSENAPLLVQESKEDPKEKRVLILKFIDVFGTRKLMTENFDLMLKDIAEEKPQEAAQIRQRVKVDEIIERLIPLYDKYFTSQELKGYIDFYSSSLGQKLLVHISDVMRESIQVSAQYMKEKFPEITQEQ